MLGTFIKRLRAELFLSWRFFIQRYVYKWYVISNSNRKGRRCKRRGRFFLKIVPSNHPRHFSFVNEMRITQSLRDLNFVPRFVGRDCKGDLDVFYYRYVDVISLKEVLRYQITLSKQQFQAVERQLYQCLTVLKERKVAHRDINPSNVLVDLKFHKMMLIDFQWAMQNGEEIVVSHDYEKSELKKCLKKLNAFYRPDHEDGDHYESDKYSAQKILAELQSLVND